MAHIFITGATDGIGLALAKYYHQQGAQLILHGRRALDDLSDPIFNPDTYIQADLAHPDAAPRIVAWLDAHAITTLDVLIHNAGAGFFGELAAQSPENIAMIVDVNLRAPVAITHALLPRLAGGKLVFVSSVVTALPTPDYTIYTATKAALDAFANNLRIELGDRVDVKILHPGATRTGMHRKIGVPDGRMDTSKFATPEETARGMAQVIAGRRSRASIGLTNVFLRFIGTHFAYFVDRAMIRAAKKQP